MSAYGQQLREYQHYQISWSKIDRLFDRSNGIGRPIARLIALESRFICQSPRAICSALKMQLSLDGIPHRSQRSQSLQTNSADCRKDRSVLTSLLTKSRTSALMFVSLLRPPSQCACYLTVHPSPGLAFMTIGPQPNSCCIDRSANTAHNRTDRRASNALCAKPSKAVVAYRRPTTKFFACLVTISNPFVMD